MIIVIFFKKPDVDNSCQEKNVGSSGAWLNNFLFYYNKAIWGPVSASDSKNNNAHAKIGCKVILDNHHLDSTPKIVTYVCFKH